MLYIYETLRSDGKVKSVRRSKHDYPTCGEIDKILCHINAQYKKKYQHNEELYTNRCRIGRFPRLTIKTPKFTQILQAVDTFDDTSADKFDVWHCVY